MDLFLWRNTRTRKEKSKRREKGTRLQATNTHKIIVCAAHTRPAVLPSTPFGGHSITIHPTIPPSSSYRGVIIHFRNNAVSEYLNWALNTLNANCVCRICYLTLGTIVVPTNSEQRDKGKQYSLRLTLFWLFGCLAVCFSLAAMQTYFFVKLFSLYPLFHLHLSPLKIEYIYVPIHIMFVLCLFLFSNHIFGSHRALHIIIITYILLWNITI